MIHSLFSLQLLLVLWYFSGLYFCLSEISELSILALCILIKLTFKSYVTIYSNPIIYTKHWTFIIFCLSTLNRALPKMFNISWVFASFERELTEVRMLFFDCYSVAITHKPLLLKSVKCWIIGNLWFKESKDLFLYANVTVCLFVFVVWLYSAPPKLSQLYECYITLDDKISNQVSFILKKNDKHKLFH